MFDILDTGGVPVPTSDAAAPGPAAEPAPLGQLLRERGLLTEEQLHTGLAQHEWSGRPLGEVLIALGFVSESTIAQALATQHGGLLKTDYGFATGFDTSVRAGSTAAPPISPPSAQVRPPLTTVPTATLEPEPAAATVVPLHQTTDAVPLAANPALEAAQAEVSAAHGRIVELEGELAAAHARSDEDGGRIFELEQAVVKARDERTSAANAAYEVAQAHVNAADARVAELEQELTAVRQGEIALRAEYERQATELDATRNELATRHAELASTLETLRAAYARLEYLESTQPPTAQPITPPQPPVRESGQRQAAFPWQQS